MGCGAGGHLFLPGITGVWGQVDKLGADKRMIMIGERKEIWREKGNKGWEETEVNTRKEL